MHSGWRVRKTSAGVEGRNYTFLRANDEKVQSKQPKFDPPPLLSRTLNAENLHTLHFFQKTLTVIGVTGGGSTSTNFGGHLCKVLRLTAIRVEGRFLAQSARLNDEKQHKSIYTSHSYQIATWQVPTILFRKLSAANGTRKIQKIVADEILISAKTRNKTPQKHGMKCHKNTE
jgi:hypothetical protein